MTKNKTLNPIFALALASAGLLFIILMLVKGPAQIASAQAGGPIEPTIMAAASLTETTTARITALLNLPGRQPLLAVMPPSTTLAAVSVTADTVTVVLSLPETALYNPGAVIDSDGINLAVIQSLYGLPFKEFHVLALDPRDPAATPKPLHMFIPLRPLENKPSAPVEPSMPAPTTVQTATANAPAATAYALTGKSVYVSAGHGWVWNGSSWKTQRPPYQNIIEDFQNAEAVNQYLIEYLRNAGADVFPVRDPSMMTIEIVMDNGDGGYSETGSWTDSTTTGSRGGLARYASSVSGAQATASATWTALIPVSGWYPVYAWYTAGPNRVPDARYEIQHAAGTRVVLVDQRKHGYTWRYLGTFYFRAGQAARVTLLNRSSIAGQAVMADAVRMGAGMGDTYRGGSISGKPRYEEASRYWVMLQGAPIGVYDPISSTTDQDDDVTARPRYADWENAHTGDDAVYVSWHTNGYNGTARGTVSYVYNNDPDPDYAQYRRITGSLELMAAVHTRVIQAIHTAWDASWYDRGGQLYNLGEIRVAQTMPSMLIEMAYHDNVTDALALKDPRFEHLLARAMYQGIVGYYAQKTGATPSYLPEPPQGFRMRNTGNGQLTLAWQAPATFAFGTPTDPAQSYRVYLSDDGFAWDEGHAASGTSFTMGGLAANRLLYARVTAVNAGGESFPTPVLAARVGSVPRALIVHGFDTLDSSMNVVQTVGSYSGVVRMFVDRMNRQNYIVQHAGAIDEPFDSAVHGAVANGSITLAAYRLVDWYAGRQSVGDGVLNSNERQALSNYASLAGRVLFINGANIAAHLAGADPAFLTGVLHSGYTTNDAGSYAVAPPAGGLFAGLSPFSLDDGNHGTYPARSNDVIAPTPGGVASLQYGTGAVAAIVYTAAGRAAVINLGFPFETVYPATAQRAIMQRAFALLPAPALTPRAFLPAVIRQPPVAVEARAVWISRFNWCLPAPCSRATLEHLINRAADAHFNIVLFQVRATGDAYYTPGLEPWSYRLTSATTATLGQNPGWDPLSVAIQVAHARGMQLHAYVNMYSNWECARAFPAHTTPEHPFWTLGDYQANPYSYSSTWRVYSTVGGVPTPMSVLTSTAVPCDEYLWSSPGVQRVNDHNLDVVKDIVTRYDVDGVHMDRVRYPGPPFSTDPESLAVWSAVSNTLSYADWQRDVLSRWVTRIYTEVKALKPRVKLSAAVWFTYRKTAAITFPTSQGYFDYYQDSHRWLLDGSLDAIAPMIYGATFNGDITKWKVLADDHMSVQGGRQVWLGIGGAISTFADVEARIQYARSIGARGVALWSAEDLDDERQYWAALLAGPFKDVAVAP